MYEVVIRAGNDVGFQTAPVLGIGEGYSFMSASKDDGEVENVMIIPTTSVVILTWSLPQLAVPSNVTTDFFEITYFNLGDPVRSMRTENVSYDPDLLGFTASILPDGGYNFSITAMYSTPRLTSTPVTVTNVRLLEEGK